MILVLCWLTFIISYSLHINVLFMSSLLVYAIILCTHYLYARAPFLFLIHSLGRFLTTLYLRVQILDVLLLWPGVRWDRKCCVELKFFSTHSGIIVFHFYSCWLRSFLDSLYIAIIRYFFSVFIWYHVWTSICIIAVMLVLHSWFL